MTTVAKRKAEITADSLCAGASSVLYTVSLFSLSLPYLSGAGDGGVEKAAYSWLVSTFHRVS